MKILFVANRFPYPPYRGDKLKIFNLAKQLYKNHDLYLITFIQKKSDYEYIGELKKYYKEIKVVYLPKYRSVLNCISGIFSSIPFQINYFYSAKFAKAVKEFISGNHIDVIHTQHLRMSQYTHDIPDVKRILDLPDAYSLYWQRRSKLKKNIFKKIFDKIEYLKLLRYERIIKEYDLTLVCSEEDKRSLKQQHNTDNVKILSNGIDLTAFQSDIHDYSVSDRIIFTGNMDYYPNVDAVVYFAKEILPDVVKKFPKVKFIISGQNPVKKVLELQSENIIVTGFVRSIAEEYKNSSIAVSPVRVGAGTLNKVLEPMSMGIPVITSSIGFQGIGAESGRDILLADSKIEFVEAINKLMANESYRKFIGSNGKKIVTKNFGWEKIAGNLEEYFFDLTGNENYVIPESKRKPVDTREDLSDIVYKNIPIAS